MALLKDILRGVPESFVGSAPRRTGWLYSPRAAAIPRSQRDVFGLLFERVQSAYVAGYDVNLNLL
jgi:hypothetical protein